MDVLSILDPILVDVLGLDDSAAESVHAVAVAVLSWFGAKKGTMVVKQKRAATREAKANEPTVADVKAQIDSADVSIQKLWDERNEMKPRIQMLETHDIGNAERIRILETFREQAEDITAATDGLERRIAAVEANQDPKLRVWSGQA